MEKQSPTITAPSRRPQETLGIFCWRPERATDKIKKREAELVDEFKKKGLQIVNVNRKSFVDAVLKASPVESMGFSKADYDKIVAIK